MNESEEKPAEEKSRKPSGGNNRRRRKPKPSGTSHSNQKNGAESGPAQAEKKKKKTTDEKAASDNAGTKTRGGSKNAPSKRNNNNSGPNQKRQKKVTYCRDFVRTGECRFAERCRYVHAHPDEAQQTAAPASENPSEAMEVDEVDQPSEAPAPAPTATSTHITGKRFDELKISSQTKKAMREVFEYQFMTVVQAETLPTILKGEDCLARAKTGTGKTLGFLIPAVELLLNQKSNRDDIDCLVLSPTRELAFQIQTEATSLTRFHNIHSVACVGGTSIGKDHRALKTSVQILVATPGRLLDHLQNGLAQRLINMKLLIFDECDQLLDQGFRPDILRILKLLDPSKDKRQTLLFSATVPDTVSEIAELALKPRYSYIDTVGDDEEQTHLHVHQDLLVVPQEKLFHAIESILTNEVTSGKPYKIIVFFTTARLTGFMADLFNSISKRLGYNVLEIHSRKSQAVRKRASDKFRGAKKVIMFSSDVSARGMDYPDVTFVLQVGLTERAQYIHRLGRTARAGKEGKGALLLAPYEEAWMREQLKDLPLSPCPVPVQKKYVLDDALASVSTNKELSMSAGQAYRAWLGFYNAHTKKFKWDKDTLVVQANMWSKEAGLTELPSFQKKTIGKMGLKGVGGLRIE